jgi:PAS domain S-box-containing protein
MGKPSEPDDPRHPLWEKLIGLGETSARKSYYPELQLRHAELERFRALLDKSNDAIFLVEVPTGRIVDVNQSACLQTGCEREILLDRTILQVTDLDQSGGAQRLICGGPFGEEKRETVETTLHRSGGGGIDVEVTLNRLAFSDLEYVVAVARDITERKQIDRMKNEFISRAAHELRTPLTSVMGYAELLRQEGEYDLSPAQRDDALRTIWEQGKSLSAIIDDLFELSHLEVGPTDRLDRERCDLRQMVEKVVSPFRKTAPGHRFEVRIEEGCEVYVDRKKVMHALENLVGNAVKYSPRGGCIRIGGRKNSNDFYHLSLEDEGSGIPEDKLERIFEKLFRVDSSDTAIGGLGLGLSIVRGTIDAHGGRVWAENRPGGGAVFHLTLPSARMKDEG